MEPLSHYSNSYSGQASLALIGQRFQALHIWPVVERQMQIAQKVRQHQPLDKLLDLFITLLAGGVGVVEVNTRVRPDQVVQRGFGRQACAEQSTISDTLDACTASNVAQLRTALGAIMQQHSRSMRHDPTRGLLRLDVDMMGLPTNRQGEGVCKGYFGTHRAHRGRQIGRVVASDYDEIVVERLYDGARQLERSLPELVEAAEHVLQLDQATDMKGMTGPNGLNYRENTLVCVDAGGGSDSDIDWLLARRYWVLTKVHSWQRARRLARSVTQWYIDPKQPQRQVGWPTLPHHYLTPTRQLSLDWIDERGKHHYAALVSNLSDEQLCHLLGLPMIPDAAHVAPWLMLHAYDTRGGGVETQNRADQQGLGLAHRHKRSFAAQEILMLLTHLAHNFVIWMRDELAATDVRFTHYGVKRMVRDVFQIDGHVIFDDHGHMTAIQLNPRHALAAAVQAAFPLVMNEM